MGLPYALTDLIIPSRGFSFVSVCKKFRHLCIKLTLTIVQICTYYGTLLVDWKCYVFSYCKMKKKAMHINILKKEKE